VQKIQAKKTIYDLRFFPILESSRVESQAVKSRNSLNFNDWAKIPDSITLFDKNRRERMFIESGKIGFEIDRNQAIEDRTQEYKSEMMAAYKEFNPEKLHRVALREWFAIAVDGFSEQQIYNKLVDRFFRKDSLDIGFGTPPNDLALTFEWDANPWWYIRKIELGAMPKSEWLKKVKYFELAFDVNGVSTPWIAGVEDSLPSNFIFMDVDTFWLAKPPTGQPPKKPIDIQEFFGEIEKRNHEVAKRVLGLVTN